MKPRVFIGSSTEALGVAYTIQEGLAYDAAVTVWTQDIFNLSSNALDDLLASLDQFDFGIFVFQPDDLIQMRNDEFESVRDNVIFEAGLFIGRLGKGRVYFLTPQNAKKIHLPTDLLGMNLGKYDDARDDGNLLAALGPFCNQVRKNLKSFLIENIFDLANENITIKKLALEKPKNWEILLMAEMLKSRLVEINRGYIELEKGLVFKQSKSYDFQESFNWFHSRINDLKRIILIIKRTINTELTNSLVSSEVGGNIFEIKQAVNKFSSMCKELLAWEYEFLSVTFPADLNELLDLIKGITRSIIDEFNKFPTLIESAARSNGGVVEIKMPFGTLLNESKILHALEKLNQKAGSM